MIFGWRQAHSASKENKKIQNPLFHYCFVIFCRTPNRKNRKAWISLLQTAKIRKHNISGNTKFVVSPLQTQLLRVKRNRKNRKLLRKACVSRHFYDARHGKRNRKTRKPFVSLRFLSKYLDSELGKHLDITFLRCFQLVSVEI